MKNEEKGKICSSLNPFQVPNKQKSSFVAKNSFLEEIK